MKSWKVYTADSRGTQGTRGFVYAGTVEARDARGAIRKGKRQFPHYSRYKVVPESSNPACQGSGWKMNPALAFRTKAAALKYAREHGLKGFSIRKNPEGAGRGGKATGAGAGGAGGGAGAGSQGGASRTEVRSPTRTSTSTKAKTTGNITVTGGAGRGATTSVTIVRGKKKNPAALLFRTRKAALKYAREHGAKRFSIKKLKRGR
jgi:hypothetical protein